MVSYTLIYQTKMKDTGFIRFGLKWVTSGEKFTRQEYSLTKKDI